VTYDQRLVAAFAEVAVEDILLLQRRVAKREAELAGWVSKLTPENQLIFTQWRAERDAKLAELTVPTEQTAVAEDPPGGG
jgi:hypothetical protein